MASKTSAQPSLTGPSATYEVQIDGESFRVEGNRSVKVESKLKKGTTYQLAVRVSPTQILRLDSIYFEYDLPAKVFDNSQGGLRVAQIIHELGFTLTVTDFGEMDEAHRDEVLKTVTNLALKRITKAKATEIQQGEFKPRTFGQSKGKGLLITYNDSAGTKRNCMICVLAGENGDKYALSAVAEYLDLDKDEVGPWVKAALGSIQPLKITPRP